MSSLNPSLPEGRTLPRDRQSCSHSTLVPSPQIRSTSRYPLFRFHDASQSHRSSAANPRLDVISPIVVNSNLNVWSPNVWYQDKCIERYGHIRSGSNCLGDKYECEKQNTELLQHRWIP